MTEDSALLREGIEALERRVSELRRAAGPSSLKWRRGRGSPAIQTRFSRDSRTVQQGPAKRQETQIVQSCKTLDDFLPRFWLPPVRWSDIEFDYRTILWRGEHEKTGYEHRTPATDEAITALEEARRYAHGPGDALVLPAPRNPSTCVSRSRVSTWWKTAERRAGLEPKRGKGWHSLRRKFASDLIGLPLRVPCDLGGWKEGRTVLRCYQQADQARLRKALEHRARSLS